MADYNVHHDINVKGTENVLNAALEQGVKALVYTSSVAVIVDGSDINGGDESMPYPDKHLDHASATKALAEKLVVECNGRVNHRGSGELYTCCIRPEMVFGPGDNHFVPQLLDKAREGEITHMIGDGSNLVDFTYVDNVVLAHLLASEHLVEGSPALGQVYFITNGEARPFWDFLTAIFDGMGYPPPTKAIGQRLAYGTAFVLEKAGGMLKYFMNFRPKLTRQLVFNMSMNHYFSHAKATKEIGYTPVVSLDLGIERTMDWIRTTHYTPDISIFDRWSQVRAAISPDRPPVTVPLSSRHSSASSITSLDAGLRGSIIEGMGAGSPPRWYGLAEESRQSGGTDGGDWNNGRLSPKGSGDNLRLRGSFCDTILEEDEELAEFEEHESEQGASARDLVLPDDSDSEEEGPSAFNKIGHHRPLAASSFHRLNAESPSIGVG